MLPCIKVILPSTEVVYSERTQTNFSLSLHQLSLLQCLAQRWHSVTAELNLKITIFFSLWDLLQYIFDKVPLAIHENVYIFRVKPCRGQTGCRGVFQFRLSSTSHMQKTCLINVLVFSLLLFPLGTVHSCISECSGPERETTQGIPIRNCLIQGVHTKIIERLK